MCCQGNGCFTSGLSMFKSPYKGIVSCPDPLACVKRGFGVLSDFYLLHGSESLRICYNAGHKYHVLNKTIVQKTCFAACYGLFQETLCLLLSFHKP